MCRTDLILPFAVVCGIVFTRMTLIMHLGYVYRHLTSTINATIVKD